MLVKMIIVGVDPIYDMHKYLMTKHSIKGVIC